MTLWLLLVLMTAAAMFAVLWPLAQTRSLPASGHDVAVYRDQLRELERDLSEGEIGTGEAEDARVEVSRRLIAAADLATRAPSDWTTRLGARRVVAAGALVALPLGAGLLYAALGSPGLPGQPLVARAAPASMEAPLPAMVARIESHLERNPEDGRGWEVVAPVYLRLGRFDDAVKARRNALRLLGASAQREAELGEAFTAAANGIVTAEARAAFERAQQRDAHEPKSQFYLGLASEQDGHAGEAARIWRDLIAQAPVDAPWVDFVRRSLARVEPSAPAVPGPGVEDMSAAAVMTSDQRTQMVRGMVERLAARLHEDGSDPEGWLRLMRAYMVLGERDKAQDTAAQARGALAGEPERLRRLNDGIKELNLEG